ncbi:MAG: metal ABC transporter permease [Candidatus Eremiobacteraeota bacterium]|nr:metal ABC transporter permease [Candidatus Eremiobacteraeota bacterium]MBC5802657.1 metal ABC transporter permease [Candidatus Eremiobacteraeota bacterium]MBC5822042.1 metal ABC transporter permease [Candidatus Eremiobacteraeota bacterium]
MNDFFASPSVQMALFSGGVVAALSAAIGYFVVLRGLSFAGHALTDIGLTGAAAALLVGIAPLWGLIAFSLAAALAIGALGERARERDLATGLVLAVALGLGALFLHLQTSDPNAQSVLLFGSIFETDAGSLRAVILVGAVALVTLGALFRPLLFASVAADTARGLGVPVRAVGFAFLAIVALAVAETAQVVGVLIAAALLIGPPAAALALVRRPLAGIALAIVLGVSDVWLSTGLAYASFGWSSGHAGWPVSFFVAIIALGMLLGARTFSPSRA